MKSHPIFLDGFPVFVLCWNGGEVPSFYWIAFVYHGEQNNGAYDSEPKSDILDKSYIFVHVFNS